MITTTTPGQVSHSDGLLVIQVPAIPHPLPCLILIVLVSCPRHINPFPRTLSLCPTTFNDALPCFPFRCVTALIAPRNRLYRCCCCRQFIPQVQTEKSTLLAYLCQMILYGQEQHHYKCRRSATLCLSWSNSASLLCAASRHLHRHLRRPIDVPPCTVRLADIY